ILLSACESNVASHAVAHQLFRASPSGFITVALQHGFECLGFLHNAAHDRAYGRFVGFAADVVCAWFGRAALKSLPPDARSKLYVRGPPLLSELHEQRHVPTSSDSEAKRGGLVCENLHSVRFGGVDLREQFLSAFTGFAAEAAHVGIPVSLRPHPAGRY